MYIRIVLQAILRILLFLCSLYLLVIRAMWWAFSIVYDQF